MPRPSLNDFARKVIAASYIVPPDKLADHVLGTGSAGDDAILKYINFLRARDPSRANRLSRALKLAAPSATEADKNLQQPNVAF